MPPPPLSIATASLKLSEDIEAEQNSHQAQEKANISSLEISDADVTTKPQAQAPKKSHNNPSSNTAGKTACEDSNNTRSFDTDSNGHLFSPNSGISDISNFAYDPGGTTFNAEDGSVCDKGTSSSSSSSDDAPYADDTHYSLTCNCDKSFLMADIYPLHP
jgi:hypothetical protein